MKDTKIYENIRLLRNQYGFTQEQLAAMIGVNAQSVKAWENPNLKEGKVRDIKLSNLLALCEAFQCDLDYLTGRIEQRTHDLNTLCLLSGMTESAAEKVQKWNHSGSMITPSLSVLIESEKFGEMIESYSIFLSLCKEYKDYNIRPGQFSFLQTDGDRVIMTADEAIYHYMSKTALLMQSICDENMRKIHNEEK